MRGRERLKGSLVRMGKRARTERSMERGKSRIKGVWYCIIVWGDVLDSKYVDMLKIINGLMFMFMFIYINFYKHKQNNTH